MMSDLINNYKEQYKILLEEMLEFHNIHIRFLKKRSNNRKVTLRKNLRRMRLAIKSMERISAMIAKEEHIGRRDARQLKKENNDE